MNASYYIKQLKLQPHPEGGYYKRSYCCDRLIDATLVDSQLQGQRSLCTAIYFLLQRGNFSAFHKLASDEMWHFYDGDPLLIHIIDPQGNYSQQCVGRDISKGQQMQWVVPAYHWFASEVMQGGDYTLVGCTVSLGFDFKDFQLADKHLITRYPQHKDVIMRLMR